MLVTVRGSIKNFQHASSPQKVGSLPPLSSREEEKGPWERYQNALRSFFLFRKFLFPHENNETIATYYLTKKK